MEQGWDPDVKRFFVKILNSICMGLIWMMASAIAGIYFGLAYTAGKPIIYTILFYTAMLAGLLLLILYYYRLWRK